MRIRICLSCCNRAKGKGGRCPFCGGTIITDTVPDSNEVAGEAA